MTKFKMNKDLEGIVNHFAGNLQTIEEAKQREDPRQPYTTNVYSERDAVDVTGSSERVTQHALAHMSQFKPFFEEKNLTKEQWKNFLNDYYVPLETPYKDGAIKRSFEFLTKEEKELLLKSPYYAILLAMEDLAKLVNKESLSEKDIGEKVAKHFAELVKGKDGKKEVKLNPYAAAALQDYQHNREGVRSLMEMRLRVYNLEKSKTPRDDIDEVMQFNEKDATENYSIGNYAKATNAYRMTKTQEAEKAKKQAS